MHFDETSERTPRVLSTKTARGTENSRKYPRLNSKQYNETMLPFGKRKYLREILELIPRGFLILQTINSKTILVKLYTQFQRDSNNARSFPVGFAERNGTKRPETQDSSLRCRREFLASCGSILASERASSPRQRSAKIIH